MLNTDEIRKEAAVNHGLILDENDPALELVKINGIVLERCLETLLSKNEEHHKVLVNELQKSIAASKETAGKVITQAADYVSEQVNTAATSAMEDARKEIMKDLTISKMEMQAAKNAIQLAFLLVAIGVLVLSFM